MGDLTQQFDDEVCRTPNLILAAEISPELVPVKEGETAQSTEAMIGPYELQDFNLFYTLRYGFRPSKIAFLALHAWESTLTGGWPVGFATSDRRSYDLTEAWCVHPKVFCLESV
jgi:NAD+ synthase (glutamine-hydrolysing)